MSNIVAVLIVRCTHTGVYADGRPNPASVTLYDLDEITIQKNRTRAVPVPPNSYVDIPMSTRTFISWHQGDICTFTRQGLITSEIILQFRDKSRCGGPAGTGQTLRPAVPNIERVGGVLRLVLPDNVIPTTLETLGFLVGEPVAITGLTGAFRNLNGEYVISTATPGSGLAGVAAGSYLIEVPSEGADIASTTLAGVNVCLTEGQVTMQFNGNGDVGGLGANVYAYIAGQLLPGTTGGGGGGSLQDAYEVGNTIVTSAGFGPFDVSGTEDISLATDGVIALSSSRGETFPAATLTTTGLNGDSVDFFVGDNDPSGVVTGQAGSLFFRDTGAGAELYLNTSAGSGTTWTLVSLGGGAGLTLQQAYDNGNTIVTSAVSGDFDVSGTESVSLDAEVSSNFTVAGTDAGALDLTLSSSNAGTGTGNVLISASDAITATTTSGNITGTALDGGIVFTAIGAGNDANLTSVASDVNLTAGDEVRVTSVGGSLRLDSQTTDILATVGTLLDLSTDRGEALPISTWTTTGASGDSVDFFVGDNDPSGAVTGQAGSVFFRDTGTGGELYINTSTGSGTSWSEVVTSGNEASTAVLAWGNNSVANSTAARVLDPGYEQRTAPLASSTAFIELRSPIAGTLQNMYVRHNNPGGSGAVITYTVFVNGVATALTVGLASTSSNGSDTVNSVAVSAGDLIRIQVTKVAVAGSGARRPEVTVEVAA